MSIFGGRRRNLDGFEAEARHMLLTRMVAVQNSADQREVNQALVEATRWLTTHPKDAVVTEARDCLRARFAPLH